MLVWVQVVVAHTGLWAYLGSSLLLWTLSVLAAVDAARHARPGQRVDQPPTWLWMLAAGVVLVGLGGPLLQVQLPSYTIVFVALLGLLFLALGLAPSLRSVGAAGWFLLGIAWPIATMFVIPWPGPARLLALLGGAPATYLAYRTWSSTDATTLRTLRRASLAAAGTAFIGLTTILLLDADVPDPLGRLLTHTAATVATLFAAGIEVVRSSSGLTVWYPSHYCHPNRIGVQGQNDAVGAHCAGLPEDQQFVTTLVENEGWLERLVTYTPEGGAETVVPVTFPDIFSTLSLVALLFILLALGRARWSNWVFSPALLVSSEVIRKALAMVLYGTGRTSQWFAETFLGTAVLMLGLGLAAVFALRRPGALDGILPVLDAADAEPGGVDAAFPSVVAEPVEA